jgi:predicted amidohydrolase
MVNTRLVPTLRIALLQVTAAGTHTAENLERGLAACRVASQGGADIALFPEMWQIGYTPCPKDAAGSALWADRAIETDGKWLANFRQAGARLDMAVVITYLQRWRGAPRNAATLIDREGQLVATYAKVHTCDFDAEAALTPGDAFKVADVATAHGQVRVGMMICYDREFPESARVLMLDGAEVILAPNACELTEDRLGQFRARAFENMTAVAMVNYPAPQCNGHSCAFDGVACLPDGTARDHRIVDAGPEPTVVFADVDLQLLRRYRGSQTWADAYRKPYAYGLLGSKKAKEPFIRPDSRRGRPEP